MSAATNERPTLKDIRDSSQFVKVGSRNVFDAHDESYFEPVRDDSGRPVIDPTTGKPKLKPATWKFDKKELERIAGVNNARNEVGDFSPLAIGHTDPNNPNEKVQPEIVGAALDYHVAWDEPHNKWMLRTNFYIRKEDYEESKKYPYVSIELHPQDGAIHPISLLKRAPARNLGAWTFGRNQHLSNLCAQQFDKSHSPYGMVLRYAMQYQMVEPNSEEPVVADDPKMAEGGGGMDIQVEPEHEMQYARHVAKHLGAIAAHPHHGAMVKRYGMSEGGDANPEAPPIGQPNANPSAPTPEPGKQSSPLQHAKDKEGGVSTVSPTSTSTTKMGGVKEKELPVSSDNDATEKLRMQRDSDALRFSRLEAMIAQIQTDSNTRLSQLEADKQAAVLQYSRSESERLLQQLEYEGYELNRAAEVDKMAAMTPEQRDQHTNYIRQYHRKSPISAAPMVARREPIGSMSGNPNDPSTVNRRDERVLQFWRKKGMPSFKDWNEIVAAYDAEQSGASVNLKPSANGVAAK